MDSYDLHSTPGPQQAVVIDETNGNDRQIHVAATLLEIEREPGRPRLEGMDLARPVIYRRRSSTSFSQV
jgi:hypothetical protein